MKKLWLSCIATATLLSGCTLEQRLTNTTEITESSAEEVIQSSTADIAMFGDVLLHKRIAQYDDFKPSFEPVKDIISSYDYVVANQESAPIANDFGIIGYPRFSSPPHILEALQYVGVDMLNLANNHTVDWGEQGVATLFDNIDAYQFPYVGAYKNEQDRSTARIEIINDISIGFLAYTYDTNGFYLPTSSPFSVNYIDEQRIKEDIHELGDQVDVLAVSMHWGSEYVNEENDEQRRLATILNEAGVDIIFGSHPHVLQPYALLTAPSGHETHTFYSLGNFFATITSVPQSFVGGIASLTIVKEQNEITIQQPTFTATTMIHENGRYIIYPLSRVASQTSYSIDWVQSILGPSVTVQ